MEKLPRKWDFHKNLTERRETSWVFLSNCIVLFFNLDMLSNAVAANTPVAPDIKSVFPASATCPFCFVRELPDAVLTQCQRLRHSECPVKEVGHRQGWESLNGNEVPQPESDTRHFCCHLLTSPMALPTCKGARKYNPPTCARKGRITGCR